MYKCLVWGNGRIFVNNINLLKYQEIIGKINVVGLTGRVRLFEQIGGWNYIERSEVLASDFDFVVVMAEGKTAREIEKDACKWGVNPKGIVNYRVLKIPFIEWDNIFVMMYTEEEETASRFAELPYEKKICFVPFQNGHECCCQVKFAEEDKMQFDKPFWALVNGMADGTYLYYDAVDLLLNADVKRLV